MPSQKDIIFLFKIERNIHYKKIIKKKSILEIKIISCYSD